MLGYKNLPIGLNGKALGVADSCGVPLGRREGLVRLVRIVAPDSSASFKFRARIQSWRLECPVFPLAGIRSGAQIDVHQPFGRDDKWMHGVVTAQRQSGNYGFAWAIGDDRTGGQRVSCDPVIDLGIDRALVHNDPCPASATGLHGFTKALDYVGASRTALVLQCYEETARMRR